MLYTSLNGGNPFSTARVLDNLSIADPFLSEKVALSDIPFQQWSLYKDFIKVFGKDELVKEVKEFNLKCIDRWGTKVFTIDRYEPYKISSKHLGISRVLQSFEVVLLTVLIKECLKLTLLPISLDHDGALCMVNKEAKPLLLAERLSEAIESWCIYLLNRKVEVVPKISIYKGEVKEF